MLFIQKARNFIQVNESLNWQYLLLLLLLSILGSVWGFYLQVVYGFNLLYIVSVFSIILQALLTYCYMKENGEARKIFFSLFFAAVTFFIGKYLIFEHYYDYFLEAYIDRSTISWEHITFYFKALNFDSVFLFVDNMSNFMGIGDIILFIIMLVIALLPSFMPIDIVELQNDEEKIKRIRYNKRRF